MSLRRHRLVASITCVLVSGLVAASGQDLTFSPDTPWNHWQYEGLAAAQSLGLIGDFTHFLGKGVRPMDHYELAVYYDVAALELAERARLHRDHLKAISMDLPGSEAARKDVALVAGEDQTLWHNPLLDRTLMAFERASNEFEREYRSIGWPAHHLGDRVQSIRATRASFGPPQTGAALRQFPDVAANHWAARAVLKLRRAGILDGYPDGKFHG